MGLQRPLDMFTGNVVIEDIRNSRHDQRDHLRGRHDDSRNPLILQVEMWLDMIKKTIRWVDVAEETTRWVRHDQKDHQVARYVQRGLHVYKA
jgi:hypothetical protein